MQMREFQRILWKEVFMLEDFIGIHEEQKDTSNDVVMQRGFGQKIVHFLCA